MRIHTRRQKIRKKVPVNLKPHCHTYTKNLQDTHTEKKNNC